MSESRPTRPPIGLALAQFVAATLLGVIALPLLSSGSTELVSSAGPALPWLVVALGCSVWLIVVSMPLTRALVELLAQVDAGRGGSGARLKLGRSQARPLASWTSAAVLVFLIQAILRRPLATAFGIWLPGVPAEAAIGAAALLLLLLTLLLAYISGRRPIEGATWLALDAVVPTLAAEPSSAGGAVVSAGGAAASSGAEPTRPSAPDEEATRTAPATTVADQASIPAAPTVPSSEDATRLDGS